MSAEEQIERYVQQAISEHETLEDAAIWLAVWVANEAAASADPGQAARVPSDILEAYRRVSRMAQAEADPRP